MEKATQKSGVRGKLNHDVDSDHNLRTNLACLPSRLTSGHITFNDVSVQCGDGYVMLQLHRLFAFSGRRTESLSLNEQTKTNSKMATRVPDPGSNIAANYPSTTFAYVIRLTNAAMNIRRNRASGQWLPLLLLKYMNLAINFFTTMPWLTITHQVPIIPSFPLQYDISNTTNQNLPPTNIYHAHTDRTYMEYISNATSPATTSVPSSALFLLGAKACNFHEVWYEVKHNIWRRWLSCEPWTIFCCQQLFK